MNLRTIQAIIVGVAMGSAVGIGAYTFSYAKGGSYLTNNPAACANCHIMNEQYDGWTKSSHHAVAVCNDCHAPANFFAKYAVKAENGFRHSLAFTTGNFHEPIEIKPHNLAIAENACHKCHQEIVDAIESNHTEKVSCIRCHQSVGHL